MRIHLFAAAACALLAACGGPETSQANNSQANISNTASPPATATGTTTSNSMVMLAAAPSKVQALAIMHERHEGMETIGKNFKALHRELDASSPALAVIRASAAKIAGLSHKASGWFAKGTGPELGKTGAKPAIWQDPKDFTAKLAAFQKAAPLFATAAAGNDLAATKARYADLGQACKACHDKYRAEMKH
jgi:cytochrome c556